MSNLLRLFSLVGENGPIILYIISIYLLWNKHVLYTFYNIGFLINIIINLILKEIIKQPRPSDNLKHFELVVKNRQRFLFKDGTYYDIFGMPSGHAQSTFFSSSFIYFSLQHNLKILLLFLSFTFITLYQRVYFSYHTLIQIIAGGIVGTCIGYLFFHLSQSKLKGNLREKPDDNAIIH